MEHKNAQDYYHADGTCPAPHALRDGLWCSTVLRVILAWCSTVLRVCVIALSPSSSMSDPLSLSGSA